MKHLVAPRGKTESRRDYNIRYGREYRKLRGKELYKKQRETRKDNLPAWKRREKIANLKRKFGDSFTIDDYERLLKAQGGVCAICGKINNNGRELAVDHDHSTGKVRELLCTNCNTSFGLAGEDINVLEKMIAYKRKHTRSI